MLQRDPLWYKKGVFYELSVKSFCDSNGDGIGDIQGVVEKLDYLQWLGVTGIWFNPIFKSPQKDFGYDVSDYYSIQPEYGTVEDVVRLIDAAHMRGIRVISDLVINHTSDQHSWFQESRKSRNNPYRDWYLWSDTPDKFKQGQRVIFTDSESSNWEFDKQTGQYFFHRFFSHQPDLNYDNPKVQEAMINVALFWMERGFDGLRLDAVPFLFKKEGTSCESLPETHAFIKKLRSEIDRRYPDRILLAEVDQWPKDLIPYYGDGDECHLCFHFPLMQRLFLALLKENSTPVIDIMEKTPPIPDNCQWQLFLRNHDEVTLQMVSDEDRAALYAEYAKDPRMKKNVGIKRRLAPMLENGRRQLELFHGLLLSLPGSPMLYYGDEICMGDNIYLPDRDSVRTPMQWSNDRNGGFSNADFAALYSPPVMDPVYGKQATNVEAQMRSPNSFLIWLKRLIDLRKQYPVFGTGEFKTIPVKSEAVFAYIRYDEDKTVLCVSNFSRAAQPVELDLSEFKGKNPVEILGKSKFPPIGDWPYLLTLPANGFFWFLLEEE